MEDKSRRGIHRRSVEFSTELVLEILLVLPEGKCDIFAQVSDAENMDSLLHLDQFINGIGSYLRKMVLNFGSDVTARHTSFRSMVIN